jgi:O-antigen/teichoic acid export membrane protein
MNSSEHVQESIAEQQSSSRKVAGNFAWNGIEQLLVIVGAMFITIAMARVIGPTRLGYFNFLYWTTNISGVIGSLGIPRATWKYMAEYRGEGRMDLVRSVYAMSLKMQIAISGLIALAGIALVLVLGDPAYRTVAILLVVSIVPQMITFIPSKANEAREMFSANVKAGVISLLVNLLGVLISLLLGWDLVGVAATVLLYRVVELGIKAGSVQRWIGAYPIVALPPDLFKKLLTFSGLGTGLMVLQFVIWDRSDILLLKMLQPDIKQIAFFSICFSLAERGLRLPQAFGAALSATQAVQYGRDKDRLYKMTADAGTYVLILAIPMLLAAAVLREPIITLLYGTKYLPAIPVFAVVALFAIPKAILTPAESLLNSTGDLKFLLYWGGLCGAVNIALDLALIPHYGALGAAYGNGTAQTLGMLGIWGRAIRHHGVAMRWASLGKVVLAACATASVISISQQWSEIELIRIVLGSGVGALTFVLLLRLLRVFSEADRARFLQAGLALPARLHSPFREVLNFVLG